MKSSSYSNACTPSLLTHKDVIERRSRLDFVLASNFVKNGYGLSRYDDDNGETEYAVLCRWKEGKREGKGWLYDDVNDRFVSYLAFCNDVLVEEKEFVWEYSLTGIIDAPDGSRWEGDIYNGSAHGYGRQFNWNNTLVYEGYCYHNKREGKGIEFYADVVDESIRKSYGYWHQDHLIGEYAVFDRCGTYHHLATMINGNAVDPVVSIAVSGTVSDSNLFLSTIVRILRIEDNCGQELTGSLSFDCYEFLESIHIGEHCFGSIRCVSIAHLELLEALWVGDDSFTLCDRDHHIPWEPSQKQRIQKERRACSIQSCPRLETIYIGKGCFSDYITFTIEQLDALRVLHLGRICNDIVYMSGSWNFYWCSKLCLRNLPSLQDVEFGNYSFYFTNTTCICNCAALQQIVVGKYSLCNFEARKKGLLTLQNLPSFQTLIIGSCAFWDYSRVCFEDVERLQNVELEEESFWNLKQLRRKNIPCSVFNLFNCKRKHQPSVEILHFPLFYNK